MECQPCKDFLCDYHQDPDYQFVPEAEYVLGFSPSYVWSLCKKCAKTAYLFWLETAGVDIIVGSVI